MNESRGNEIHGKIDQQKLPIAMDIDEDIDEDGEERSSDATSDVQNNETKPFHRKINATNLFINDTMRTTMVNVNKQFAHHTPRILGQEGQVEGNMRSTKQIKEHLDNHIADIPRQHKSLANNIVNHLRPKNAGTGNEQAASTTPVPSPKRTPSRPKTPGDFVMAKGRAAKVIQSTSRILRRQKRSNYQTHCVTP